MHATVLNLAAIAQAIRHLHIIMSNLTLRFDLTSRVFRTYQRMQRAGKRAVRFLALVSAVVYQATQAYIKERLIVLQYPWVTTAREPTLGPPPFCLMGFPESSVMSKEDVCAPRCTFSDASPPTHLRASEISAEHLRYTQTTERKVPWCNLLGQTVVCSRSQ